MEKPQILGYPILRVCAQIRWKILNSNERRRLDSLLFDVLTMKKDQIEVDITTKIYDFDEVDIYIYRFIISEGQFVIMKDSFGKIAVIDFALSSVRELADLPVLNEIPA